MGGFEAVSLGIVELTLKYHPDCFEVLTGGHESGHRTLLGGQFDWGGRLQKSNGGARRSAQADWKPAEECKGISRLDCETYKSSRNESWS